MIREASQQGVETSYFVNTKTQPGVLFIPELPTHAVREDKS